MSEPFMAEIKIMTFNYAPRGWAFCNGQLLPINQNQALFSLLGTIYGGDGQRTFGLPDLRGRVPVHRQSVSDMGQRGGETAHTVTMNEMPPHGHPVSASSTATGGFSAPANNYLGGANNAYHALQPQANLTTLNQGTVTTNGGTQPHENMQPYLTLNFCIALQGIFPSQN